VEKKQLSLPPIGVINFSVYRHKKEIEAISIKIREGKIAKSKEIGAHGEAVVDLDKKGNVIGIEMLEPGLVTVRLVNKIRKEFKIPELATFRIDRLQGAFPA
jgi:uncharacterized protein YuzE